MNGNFIVNTPKYQMHALAYQGIIVMDCYAQIRDLLRGRLGDDYVLLFAEPVSNAADNSVDWYTPVQGTPRRLLELPEAEQDAIREKLAHMAEEIRHVAQELKNSPEQTRVGRGAILELALRYPDEQSLFVIGGQPVFTCWGFGPGTPGAEPQDLSRLSRKAVRATVVPEGAPAVAPLVVERRSSWLRWLLPFLLLLLLLFVLVTSFGSWPALSGFTLFHAPALPFGNEKEQALLAVQQKKAGLEQELGVLKQQLTERAAQCTPVAPGQAKPVPPVASVQTKPVPPVAEAPKKEDELVLPKKTDDMAFLEGKWRCETGLINSKTQEPLIVEYVFDAKGQGQVTVYEKKTACTGAARAAFSSEGLRLDVDAQKCANGEEYKPLTVLCTDQQGSAQCVGTSQSTQWEAKFYRIK